MALLILALLQRIFLMSSLMLLLVWLIFFMVLIKLLPILGTISGKTVKLMVLALICRSEERFSRNAEIGRAVQQECRDRTRMPSSARKKNTRHAPLGGCYPGGVRHPLREGGPTLRGVRFVRDVASYFGWIVAVPHRPLR